jgi:superfamily II DNA or RNA helicase
MSRDILPSHEVAFVEGEVSSDVRDQVYEKLKIGSMRVMIVTPLGDEGLDLPPVDGLILADGGKSPVEKIQQIGRGLRPFKSKINCQIRDYLDEGPIVGKHAQARLNLYSSIERSWRVSIVGTRETVAVQSKGRDVTW